MLTMTKGNCNHNRTRPLLKNWVIFVGIQYHRFLCKKFRIAVIYVAYICIDVFDVNIKVFTEKSLFAINNVSLDRTDSTDQYKSRISYIPRERETCSQFNENGTYELPIIRE